MDCDERRTPYPITPTEGGGYSPASFLTPPDWRWGWGMLNERPSTEELEDVFLPDCADEALRDAPAMQERCRDCPGRSGTDASMNEITVSLLSDCKRRRFPFMCHMTRTRNDLCSHLCADWVAAVTGRAALQEKDHQP